MTKKRFSVHDRFFRASMKEPKIFKEFFQEYLPYQMRKMIDFNSIKPESESFIDKKLKLRITDMLYSAKLKIYNDKDIYLLVEHQSSPDKSILWRIHKYKTEIKDCHYRKTGKLPVVYPMVFYTGKRKYNYSMDFFDLFGEQQKLARYIEFNPCQLVDLKIIDISNTRRHLCLKTMSKTMKHIYEKDFLPYVKDISIFFETVEKNVGMDYIDTTINYMFEMGSIKDKEKFFEIIETNINDKKIGGKIMTIAESLRKEGERKGREEGVRFTLELLKQGKSIKEIAEITGLR